MRRIATLMVFISAIANAQTERGIEFVQGLSWSQILEKASNENKYIFVDCFATWCMPCKIMDKTVYTNDTVGAYMNQHFIAVKLQMDTSKNDPEEIKAMYATASRMMKEYKITGFPSYLFFSCDGKIVHRDIGAMKKEVFLYTARCATDPAKQFYTQLNDYLQGKRRYVEMANLAITLKRINEPDLSGKIARDYIDNYLLKGHERELLKKANIEFTSQFIRTENDSAFKYYYSNSSRIDDVMTKGYAQSVLDFIINKEELVPMVQAAEKSGQTPQWADAYQKIKTRYGNEFADRITLTAKVRWYKSKEDWINYTKLLTQRVEKYGAFGIGILDFDLNNHAWEIFLHSKNKSELNKALKWSNRSIALNPNYSNSYDTNANLLYKLGNKKEALRMEEKAILIEPKNRDYKVVLEKMKNGETTWPD